MSVPKFVTYGAVALSIIALAVFAAIVWYGNMQISRAEALKVCANFYDEVATDIAALPEYTVVDGAKTCTSIEDELSFDDYKLHAAVLVATTLTDESEIKASMKTLSDTLPKRAYPVAVYNTPLIAEPGLLCITASRYLDNDGQDVPQEPPTHSYRYSAATDTYKATPCDKL